MVENTATLLELPAATVHSFVMHIKKINEIFIGIGQDLKNDWNKKKKMTREQYPPKLCTYAKYCFKKAREHEEWRT